MSRSEEARKETELDKDIRFIFDICFTESANRFCEVNQISHLFDHFCENIDGVLLAEKWRESWDPKRVSCLNIFLKGLQLPSSKFVFGKIKYAFEG